MKKILVVTGLFFLILSCKKKEEPVPAPPPDPDPVACIQTDKEHYPLNQAVNFKNCSQHSERVEWNFGDGQSATISDPGHVYASPNVYTVKLKAFKGTRTSDASKKIVAANTIDLYCKVAWSNIQIDYQQYESIDAFLYLIKNNGTPSLETYHNVYVLNYQNPLVHNIPVTDVSSKYRIRLLLHWRENNGDIIRKDSVTSDEISIIDGVKTPTIVSDFPYISASQTHRVDYKL